MENVTKKDQIVVEYSGIHGNRQFINVERVESIRMLGYDGKEHVYPLDQIRHMAATTDFFECTPKPKEAQAYLENANGFKLVAAFPGTKPFEIKEGPLVDFIKEKLAEQQKDQQNQINAETADIAIRTLQELIDKLTTIIVANLHTEGIDALRWDLGVIQGNLVEVKQNMRGVYDELETKIERLEERLKASNELNEAFRTGATRGEQDRIEQQGKAIDALKFTIEVMSKTIGDQQKENEKLEHTLKAIYDGADPLNLPDDPWVKAGRRMVIADNIKSPVEVAAAEHVPVLFLKVTNPGEGDIAEATEVLKHWRPNFEIVKTNLRDCSKGSGMPSLDEMNKIGGDE